MKEMTLKLIVGVSMLSLVHVFSLSGQVLVTECIHRDSADRVIYLEREYLNADTVLYFSGYSDDGRLLKQWSKLEGDTVVESVVSGENPEHGEKK